ncbi:MAG: hypothetical protein BZ135_06295 [Methanosphaera sp. rholeuAM6]|nr:MAG: hypothetical protein BZ135_06295 [Methanosphaera sp. rholeuAM6]
MKNLANYISLSRIALSVLMLFTQPLSLPFFTIFIICGASDILDGLIARHYRLSTDFGAKLDSIADILFFISLITVLIPILNLNSSTVLWIIIIFLIRMSSIFIGFKKHEKLVMVHTILNKLTGACIILLPFLLLLIPTKTIIVILCIIATLASLEELIIVNFTQNLNCNSIADLMIF